MRKLTFKKHLLTSSIAMAVASGMSVHAFAADESTVDEVVVTGIKASLTRSMDIKREAAGVVDAISAEDIGKMPDANLAESLQRISGVSIDRSNGEGSKVTVRGLAGDYNLVTLNGRQMPASTVGSGAASTSRSFDFANLASEGVAGVEVYKTGRADVDSGGMGALINIITPHPLKNPGLKATIGVKAVDDLSTITGGITPEVSGLFSDTFADDTIGVALTGSYQKRDSGSRNAYVGGWFTHVGNAGDWAGIPEDKQPAGGGTYSHPINVGYSFVEDRRERTNGQATFQYKPVDSVTITADYLYVDQTIESEKHSAGMWFTRTADLAIQWSATSPKYPISYTETTGNHDYDSSVFISNRKSDLKSAGLNVQWEATDHLKFEIDGHNSNSHAGPDSKYGTEGGFDSAVFKNYRPTLDLTGEIPKLHLDSVAADGSLDTTPNPTTSLSQLSGNNFKNSVQDSYVHEYQFKGQYSFDDGILKNVKFGASQTRVGNTSIWRSIAQENQGNWSGVGSPSDISQDNWKVDNWSNYFDGSLGSGFQNAFIRTDFNSLMAVGAKLYGVTTATTTSPCVQSYCATMDPNLAKDGMTDYRTLEDSKAGYLQANFASDFNGLPTHLSVGVRYESTGVLSKSLLQTYGPIISWSTGNEFSLQATGSAFLASNGAYSELLPSVDYDIELTDTVKARASYSKTMARPAYDQIRGGLSFDANPRIGSGSGSSGNPDLNPLVSGNYDLSVEWYYGESSYVSVGYFMKAVKDFIGTEPYTIAKSGFHTIVGGARWQSAVAAGIDPAKLGDMAAYIVANTPADQAGTIHRDASGKVIGIDAVSDDPELPFTITRPVNNKDAMIHGIEASIQHTFGESGFGVQANYTKVDSDTNFDNNSIETQFAILGLSDSANLVAFYDKDGIQGRIAYNWRDEFLTATNDGAGKNPQYVEAYGQVDATVSYKVTDNLTVSLEGLNILNETTRTHGRDWHEVLNYGETGARYNLGARYTF